MRMKGLSAHLKCTPPGGVDSLSDPVKSTSGCGGSHNTSSAPVTVSNPRTGVMVSSSTGPVMGVNPTSHTSRWPPVISNRVENNCPIPNLVSPARQPSPHRCRKPSAASNIESPSQGKRKSEKYESEISPAKRARIVKEVLEEKIAISEIAKKYNRSVDSIRGWVREAAGHQLLESCKRFQFFLLLKNALCIILQY